MARPHPFRFYQYPADQPLTLWPLGSIQHLNSSHGKLCHTSEGARNMRQETSWLQELRGTHSEYVLERPSLMKWVFSKDWKKVNTGIRNGNIWRKNILSGGNAKGHVLEAGTSLVQAIAKRQDAGAGQANRTEGGQFMRTRTVALPRSDGSPGGFQPSDMFPWMTSQAPSGCCVKKGPVDSKTS